LIAPPNPSYVDAFVCVDGSLQITYHLSNVLFIFLPFWFVTLSNTLYRDGDVVGHQNCGSLISLILQFMLQLRATSQYGLYCRRVPVFELLYLQIHLSITDHYVDLFIIEV
jgi:hypothetical protein